jgi:hypothetical protein
VTTPSYASLAEQVGTTFAVAVDGTDVELDLELVEISEQRLSGRWEVFSLLFRGPSGPLLGQAEHAFDHPALGALRLFIVPVVPDRQGPLYEAVFNRERTPDGGRPDVA